MKNSKLLLSASLAGILAAGASAAAEPAKKETEKCYGIAKAGKNDCANASGTHGCAGHAKMDNDPGEFMFVGKGECAGKGGQVTPKKL